MNLMVFTSVYTFKESTFFRERHKKHNNMTVALHQLFESHKDELSLKLKGLRLPSDENQLFRIVYDYLNSVFDSNGDFRQSLTLSEDYILQAAISLLNAQRDMAESIKNVETNNPLFNEPKIETNESSIQSKDKSSATFGKYANVSSEASLIGAGVGAVAGKLVLGGWGAVFGALTGTAIAIYVASLKNENTTSKTFEKKNAIPVSIPVNVEGFVNTISSICSSVDNLLDTFRAQINNVVEKYESQPKPSLDSNYLPLLESIQTLVGYERTHSEEEERFAKKLKDRIEDVSEVLDTWNLTFEDYSGTNESFFELIPSDKTTERKMVYPAILKNGAVVIKGKVFIPLN